MKNFNYNQCGKYFAKGFKLKVHIQNVHEIEKIRYESINDIMEMISTFRNLQNSNIKFVKRNYLELHFFCFYQLSYFLANCMHQKYMNKYSI